MMIINGTKQLISIDEHRQLELKKMTGELKEAMHTECALLSSDYKTLLWKQYTSVIKNC
jgi:ATP-dependent DNA helicase RecG